MLASNTSIELRGEVGGELLAVITESLGERCAGGLMQAGDQAMTVEEQQVCSEWPHHLASSTETNGHGEILGVILGSAVIGLVVASAIGLRASRIGAPTSPRRKHSRRLR